MKTSNKVIDYKIGKFIHMTNSSSVFDQLCEIVDDKLFGRNCFKLKVLFYRGQKIKHEQFTSLDLNEIEQLDKNGEISLRYCDEKGWQNHKSKFVIYDSVEEYLKHN